MNFSHPGAEMRSRILLRAPCPNRKNSLLFRDMFGYKLEHGIRRATLLNVAGAYHSRLMEMAYRKLGEVLAEVPMKTPRFAVISNVTGDEVTTPEEIRRTLQDQVTGTVRWLDCIERLAELGCDFFMELGPGAVLAGLLRRTHNGADVMSVSDSASVRACAEKLRAG